MIIIIIIMLLVYLQTAQPVTDPQASNTSGLISWAAALSTTPTSAGVTVPHGADSTVPPEFNQESLWEAFPSGSSVTQQPLETTVQDTQESSVMQQPLETTVQAVQNTQESSVPASAFPPPTSSDVSTLKADSEHESFNTSNNEINSDRQAERSVNSVVSIKAAFKC
jgi:hypothetical protein